MPPRTLRLTGWILTVCFVLATFLPRSCDQVIFVDGLAYASIARNMAEGLGYFWQPHFADAFWLSFNQYCPFFCDQPPLVFGIESLLYKLLGDTLLVDAIYNAAVLAGTITSMIAIWQLLFRDNIAVREQSWLPVLFWYGFRIVWWSVPNHLLDTSLAVFCLWSCYFQLKGMSEDSRSLRNAVFGGLMVFLACFTKGPVGLFPLALPAFYFMVSGKKYLSKAIVGTLMTGITAALLLGALLLYAPARNFLHGYFHGQIVQALLQKRERAAADWTAHFYIARLVLKNALPHAVLTAVLLLWARFVGGVRLKKQTRRTAVLTLLIALSAFLPMLISVKQADYYLMPAFPFLAFSFAAICVEPLLALCARFRQVPRIYMPLLAVVCLSAMVYQLSNPAGDRMYRISGELKKHIKPRASLFLEKEISRLSEVQTPLQRYAKLSVSYSPHETPYLYFEHSSALRDSVVGTGHFQLISLGEGATLAVRKDALK